jgi:porphobilinogen synthase
MDQEKKFKRPLDCFNLIDYLFVMTLLKRPRRNRISPSTRSLVQETVLRPADLVAPFFVIPGTKKEEEIESLPGIKRVSVDLLLKAAEALHHKGIPAIALFPVIEKEQKNKDASQAFDEKGIILEAIRALKTHLPSLTVISDIALDPFTSHGHDGIVGEKGEVLNDATVALLSRMALLHAQAGVDFVAPSDMMDGRVRAIRKTLDENGYEQTGILAYTAKYASSLYAPFRQALGSTLLFGDKKTYQLNPANLREALLEAALDEEEGADMLMVKPALFYLDVLTKIRERTHLPLCAYHVSGEYAMVMAAHERGLLNADQVFLEALLIISYATPRIIDLL